MALKRPTGEALAAALAAATGHVFRDFALMNRAVTHSSAKGGHLENNERLEFLGDRVLGLTISEFLFRRFPEAREGELAQRFNALVDARTCAEVGLAMGLDRLVRADISVRKRSQSGGNVLADAVEALIAAVYLDGGSDPARSFIMRYWEPRVERSVARPPNPKSDLQEWIARSRDVRPHYVVEKREGPDHQPEFTVSAHIDGLPPALGTGSSRRAAEEAAATAFLRREGVWPQEEAPT